MQSVVFIVLKENSILGYPESVCYSEYTSSDTREKFDGGSQVAPPEVYYLLFKQQSSLIFPFSDETSVDIWLLVTLSTSLFNWIFDLLLKFTKY